MAVVTTSLAIPGARLLSTSGSALVLGTKSVTAGGSLGLGVRTQTIVTPVTTTTLVPTAPVVAPPVVVANPLGHLIDSSGDSLVSLPLARTGQYDLTVGTVQTLIDQLQTFYHVPYVADEFLTLSPLVLIDGTGDTFVTGGDAVPAYTDWHYAYLDAAADELDQLRAQVPQIAAELQTTTADGEWLDRLGDLYGIPREDGELDVRYGPRIIAEVLRPRSNNVAMEILIEQATGQVVTVTDASIAGTGFPLFNGVVRYDGSQTHSGAGNRLHGLFDVQIGYDLLSSVDLDGFAVQVTALVNRLRAAGTHLRALSLGSSKLSDPINPPTEAGDTFTVTTSFHFNGTRRYDGTSIHETAAVTTTIEKS